MAERTPVQFIDGPDDLDGFNDPITDLGNVGQGNDNGVGEPARVAEPIQGDPNNVGGTGPVLEEYAVFSPIDIGVGTPTGGNGSGVPRRRGRPPGSTNRPRAYAPDGTPQPVAVKKVSPDLGDIVETLLFSVHLMGANLLALPELELEKDEAKQMASAIREVQKHYPEVALSPKKMALMNLATVAGGIYITRGIAIYKRAPKPAKVIQMPSPKQAAQPSTHVDMPPTPKPTEMAPSDLWVEDMHTQVTEG